MTPKMTLIATEIAATTTDSQMAESVSGSASAAK